jgi:hypothetical protein
MASFSDRSARGKLGRHKKRTFEKVLLTEVDESREDDQSRSPPQMPSKANRLWKMLNKSKYRAKVAVM